ncbi:MAG: DUF2007 domain-containing protein [Chloroherpetonaceae bacterium]|nr:DUF2007 domain-containing protein [Chloroherpetonaceae bacterium]MCS7212394.1 DUF2007 domain-containing protein [Chloroherpetonaceae bacterium]MDW8020944.1 DUF2007 domain-containing protein [Chloroherpetonaceae bacterium]MDW8465560.1 DUF2007 domain-containing protein [Chloroherpetonaceae bacterium]
MKCFSDSDIPQAWRTLAQLTSPIEAELLRAYLASSNIDAYLYSKRDGMLHSISVAEPVYVLVRAEHYDEAVRLLIELDAQEPNWESEN